MPTAHWNLSARAAIFCAPPRASSPTARFDPMTKKPQSAKAALAAHRARSKPVRIVLSHIKLFVAMLVIVALFPFLPWDWRLSTRLLVAWDFGAVIYLIMAVIVI